MEEEKKRNAAADDESAKEESQLVTFFKFTSVPNAEEESTRTENSSKRTIAKNTRTDVLNEQGVDAPMGGKGTDGETYARWVEKRTPFRGMRISVYPYHEHGHPDLRLRVKPQLVQLENGALS